MAVIVSIKTNAMIKAFLVLNCKYLFFKNLTLKNRSSEMSTRNQADDCDEMN